MRLAVLILLAGCSYRRASCEVTTVEVADDEVTAAGTAEALLASVEGTEEVAAFDGEGAAVAATVTLERAEGSATFSESEPTTIKRPRFGVVVGELDIAVACNDALAAPLEVRVVAEGAGIDWAAVAEIYTVDGARSDVSHRVPWEESGLSLPAGVDAAAYDEMEAALQLGFDGAGGSWGSVSWSGSRALDDGSATQESLLLLEW